jgi:hypothetical protein
MINRHGRLAPFVEFNHLLVFLVVRPVIEANRNQKVMTVSPTSEEDRISDLECETVRDFWLKSENLRHLRNYRHRPGPAGPALDRRDRSDGTNYQWSGNFTYGSDGTTYQRLGNFTYGSDGTTCQRLSSYTYCNR